MYSNFLLELVCFTRVFDQTVAEQVMLERFFVGMCAVGLDYFVVEFVTQDEETLGRDD